MMKAGERRVYELERKRDKLCRIADRCVLRAGRLDRIAAKAWSNVGTHKERIDTINREIEEARSIMARTIEAEQTTIEQEAAE